MNVSLTEELRKFVEHKVASGLYHSASEVVRDGLRLLAEQDRQKKARLKGVGDRVAEGLASLDHDEGRPSNEVFARLEARIAKLEANKKKNKPR